MPSSIPNETNSLAAMFPDVARQLDPSLNNGTTADMVCAGSNQPMTWRCEKDPSHTYVSTVHMRTGSFEQLHHEPIWRSLQLFNTAYDTVFSIMIKKTLMSREKELGIFSGFSCQF